MESLAHSKGPGTLLADIHRSLAAATAPVLPHEQEARTAMLVRQMRLQVCAGRTVCPDAQWGVLPCSPAAVRVCMHARQGLGALQACMFRSAVRKAAAALLQQLDQIGDGEAAPGAAAAHVAVAIAQLAGQTCAAVEALQQVLPAVTWHHSATR